MTLIAGVLIDALGMASHVEAVPTAPNDPLSFRTRRVFSSLPADEIADEQPTWIPVDRNHDDRAIGSVRYLERSGGGSIWTVAHIDDPSIDPTGMSFSAATRRNHTGRGWAPADPWTITAASLTNKPAMACVGTVRVIDTDDVDTLDEAFLLRTRTHDAYLSALLRRARDTARTRRPAAALIVHDVDQRRADARLDREYRELELRAGVGPIRHGPPGRIISVGGRPVAPH